MTDACNHRIQVFDRQGKLLRYWGKSGSAPGRTVLSLRSRAGTEGHSLHLRVRQQPRAKIHPRRPLVGLLGIAGTRSGTTLQSLGVGPRQPRHDSRVGYEQSPGTIVPDGVRDPGRLPSPFGEGPGVRAWERRTYEPRHFPTRSPHPNPLPDGRGDSLNPELLHYHAQLPP